MKVLDDIEAACVIFALYEEHELSKKQQRDKIKRRHWVHPLNLKRPDNGQFQVTFMTLRSYPEEFMKYYRMSITSFDELSISITIDNEPSSGQKLVTGSHLIGGIGVVLPQNQQDGNNDTKSRTETKQINHI
ncbi:hypothetical protein ACI65C_006584 [Semiaphis heraclei]